MPIETLVGTTLAGYSVRGKVGEGGTSTVFRAEHPTHGTVALKVLREKLQQDKTAVARFLREAQFGARVEHPNIIRTLDYGQSDNERYYLAIEWATGDWTVSVVHGMKSYAEQGIARIDRRSMAWLRAHAHYDDAHPYEAMELVKRLCVTVPQQEAAFAAAQRGMEYYLLALDDCYARGGD